jgi:hypothetical protein
MLDTTRALAEINKAQHGKAEEEAALFHQKAREALGNGYLAGIKCEAHPDAGVCAADSGFAEIGLSGASFMFMRAIGVFFRYEKGKLKEHHYHPSKAGITEYLVLDSADDAELHAMKDIIRLGREWEILLGMIKKWKCGIALFDGSLVPLPSSTPANGSRLWGSFSELRSTVAEAREEAAKRETVIAGIVKDPRSRRMCHAVGMDANDMFVLQKAMPPDSATVPLPYSEDMKGVLFSYIKIGNDIPLRVEWFAESGNPLGAVCSLCRLSSYAYPPPLVEADIRSMIRGHEHGMMESAIRARFPGLAKRRDSRPFR